MKKLVWLIVAACLSTGCLNQENRHLFYMDVDGAVTWTVVEEEVRSDEREPAERIAEEREYLDRAGLGRHDVARALGELAPLWVETRIVRDRRPFTVVTEARFESVARMLESFLEGAGLEAEASLERDGDRMRLRFRFDEREEGSGVDGSGLDEWLEPLYADYEQYRFVLTDGQFVDARGFELHADASAAVMLEQEAGQTYELTWRSGPTK